jgi:DNA-directed RNA polymerase specialized sigma24 family protein
MGAGFDGREIGQYRAALVRVVWNTCHDYGRRELRHEKRSRSHDTTWDDGGEGGPYDAALARYDEQLRAEAEEAAGAKAGREEAERLARWGIAQVRNDNHRAVLELTWLEKLDAEAIAARLRISVDNVYQRRRRGLIELERILRAPRD